MKLPILIFIWYVENMPKRKRKRKKKTSYTEAYIVLGVLLVILVLNNNFDFTHSLSDYSNLFYTIVMTTLIIVVTAFLAYKLFIQIQKTLSRNEENETYAAITNMDEFQHMTGYEFEKYTAWYYRQKGYKAETTDERGDHGIDLIIEKDGEEIPVQTKKYKKGSNIGEPAIRDFLGSIRKYEKGIYITTSDYTKAAYEFAETECPELKLINGDKLIEMIHGD